VARNRARIAAAGAAAAALSARRVAARLQRAFHLKYVRYPP